MKDLFSSLQTMPEVEVFESAPSHYRMRAEFTVWHDRGDLYFVMFDTSGDVRPPPRVRVDTFPAGTVLMNELMQLVREELVKSPVLSRKLFQVSFLTALSGQVSTAAAEFVY